MRKKGAGVKAYRNSRTNTHKTELLFGVHYIKKKLTSNQIKIM